MFKELAQKRYALRNFSNQPVEDEKLQKILEVGRLAPTAANLQPQKIYVLKSKEVMNKAHQFAKMMYNAPMAFLIAYDDTKSWKASHFNEPQYDGGEVDAAIVATHMMMEATELGLGTLWVRGFSGNEAQTFFNLPKNIHPVCFLLIGYPSQNSKPNPSHTSRKPLNETVEIW